jgi:CubicO group peptidase (beta-lactamase class C family)
MTPNTPPHKPHWRDAPAARRLRWFASSAARVALLAALGVFAGGIATPAAAAPQADLAEAVPGADTLRRELAGHLERHHVPGLAIAIVHRGEIVFAEGFGVADRDTNRPVTPDTVFPIGSTTKAFTAALIGMLVDDGKMTWEDPVTDHLPYFELPIKRNDMPGEVNVTDLLAHRTGFTRMGLLWASADIPREDTLRTATRAEPWAPFRTAFLYNNVMYIAAGEIAATVGGAPWTELVQARILTPLGMTNSHTLMQDALDDPQHTRGYLWDVDANAYSERPMNMLDRANAAGAITSTANDMAIWIRFALARGMHGDTRLLSNGAWDIMWSSQMPITTNLDYGLGWMVAAADDRKFVTHDGSIDGFGAHVGLFPDHDLGYVVLYNVPMIPFSAVIPSMVWEAVNGNTADDAGTGEPVNVEGAFDEYLGEYVSFIPNMKGKVITALEQNGRLAVDVPGQTVYELELPGEDGLWPFRGGLPISVSFDRNEDGEIFEMNMHQAGMLFEMPRVGRSIPIEIPLEEFVPFLGNYAPEAGEPKFEVVIQNNRLAIDVPTEMVYELHVPDDEGWRIARAVPILSARFNRDDDGNVNGFTLRGPRGQTDFLRTAVADDMPNVSDLMAPRARIAEQLAAFGPYRMTGEVRFIHSGIEGEIVRTVDDPTRFREELNLQPFGWIHRAFTAKAGVEHTSMSPLEPIVGRRLKQAVLSHPHTLLGDWREAFDAIVVTAVDTVDGAERVTCRLSKAGVPDMHVTIDRATGDLYAMTMTLIEAGSPDVTIAMEFGDHRDIDGLRMPFLLSMTHEAIGRIESSFDTIERLDHVDDSVFTLQESP